MTKTYQVPLKYSQNFIKSSKLVEKLVALSGINQDDLVVEIGAGKGKITKVLAKNAAKVIALEKDRKLYELCMTNLIGYPNVDLVCADFLSTNLPRSEYKIFANIPFSITSEIVRKICFAHNPSSESFLIMQKEAAEKFCGYEHETIFSLMLKPRFESKIIYTFKGFDFEPVPSVEVVLFHLSKRKEVFVPSDESYREYVDFVTYAFSRWKPDVRSALRNIFSNLQLKRLAHELNFELKAKPSELTFETWMKLYTSFQKHVPEYKRDLIKGATTKLVATQKQMRKSSYKQTKKLER